MYWTPPDSPSRALARPEPPAVPAGRAPRGRLPCWGSTRRAIGRPTTATAAVPSESSTPTADLCPPTPRNSPDSLFRSARLSEDGSALIVELISGVRIEVPVAEAFVFMITYLQAPKLFEAGETRTFPLRQRGVAEIGIERPDGWAVKVSEEQVEITAPASGGEGEIVLWAVSSSARLKLAAIAVKAEGGDEPVDPIDPRNG